MIWNEAEVMENLSTIQLVHRQQTTLEASTCLDHFGLKKCTQPNQAIINWKKLVDTLNAIHHSSTLVLLTMDQIAEATFQIRESISSIGEGPVMDP